MEYTEDEARKGLMREFHNAVVTLMDKSPLSAPEAIVILRMIVNTTEGLFETAVKSPAKPPEDAKITDNWSEDDDRVEEAGV